MFFLITSFFLLAAQTIDTDMSRQDQKKTGVYKLTDKQKTALQQWIDDNYTKKEGPIAAGVSAPSNNQANSQSVLQDNLNSGRYIRLSDSSLWEINPEDTAITQGWITPVDIFVSQSGDFNYPYILTNSLTESKVRAKRIQSLPTSTSSK